ncbi:DUF732 domain-containing protein [Skermania sp. ID1734]|uniref:DUF732 domain-containing protein n=1 Tax=Skermania sp. ID1734 TaxID=2597516 RepID=UPI00117E1B11|nr:DUF732 domain-containing protein [Skermania sp. ID1734]TSD95132.1 DUF732 domain-containing protein [Skermania sp. ID1734]
MSNRFRTIASAAAAAAIVSVSMVTGAGAAFATPDQDQQFINKLDSQGITFPSANSAISDAHVVCNKFASGNTFEDVFGMVKDANPDLSNYNDGYFIGASVVVYCPQYLDALPQ